MAAFWVREEVVERRMKNPGRAVYRKVSSEYEFRQHCQYRYQNEVESTVGFGPAGRMKEEGKTIDSNEAARIYGGFVVVDHRARVSKPIDSNEAAKIYGGFVVVDHPARDAAAAKIPSPRLRN